MHKSEAEKIDSILDEHQQIYRRHNRIDNILAFFACIAWIPCIIAAFGVDGIYLKILFAVLACCGAVCFFIFFFTLLPESLMVLSRQSLNRPGFPGEYFICELRLPDHRFRWKHNKLFLLLPEEYGPAFPAIVDCYTSPPT